MLAMAAFTDWLTGVSGTLVFVATAALAKAAYVQMQKLDSQARAEAEAVEKQIKASVEQGEAIREAARAQLQPMVFAHGDVTHTRPEQPDPLELDDDARENEYALSPGQVGFGYKLANEGTGLALSIRHGVEIAGKRLEFGEGMHFRSLRPGEWQPGQDFLDRQGHWIRIAPLAVVINEAELPEDWATQPRHYWAEFENVFHERFRTRNPSDPLQPAEFERVESAAA
jgi:hypothetical protein